MSRDAAPGPWQRLCAAAMYLGLLSGWCFLLALFVLASRQRRSAYLGENARTAVILTLTALIVIAGFVTVGVVANSAIAWVAGVVAVLVAWSGSVLGAGYVGITGRAIELPRRR